MHGCISTVLSGAYLTSLHLRLLRLLLTVSTVVAVWALASFPAALLMGRVFRRLGHRGPLPSEIDEAPPERKEETGRVA